MSKLLKIIQNNELNYNSATSLKLRCLGWTPQHTVIKRTSKHHSHIEHLPKTLYVKNDFNSCGYWRKQENGDIQCEVPSAKHCPVIMSMKNPNNMYDHDNNFLGCSYCEYKNDDLYKVTPCLTCIHYFTDNYKLDVEMSNKPTNNDKPEIPKIGEKNDK